MFERLKWWLYVKKPFQSHSISMDERKRRALVIRQGLKEEFWLVLSEDLRCSLQNERNFAARHLVLGNDQAARKSALLAESILKILAHPENMLQGNQDVILEVEEELQRSNSKFNEPKSSRYSDEAKKI